MVVGVVGEVVLAAVALDASIAKAERRRRRTDCMATITGMLGDLKIFQEGAGGLGGKGQVFARI